MALRKTRKRNSASPIHLRAIIKNDSSALYALKKALIGKANANLDLGEFDTASSLLKEAESITAQGNSLDKSIRSTYAAIAYRSGKPIKASHESLNTISSAAYALAMGRRAEAIDLFKQSLGESIAQISALQDGRSEAEWRHRLKQSILGLLYSVYSLAYRNKDKIFGDAASILSLNTHGLIIDLETGANANTPDLKQDNKSIKTAAEHKMHESNSMITAEKASSILTDGEYLVEFRKLREWKVDKARAVVPVQGAGRAPVRLQT